MSTSSSRGRGAVAVSWRRGRVEVCTSGDRLMMEDVGGVQWRRESAAVEIVRVPALVPAGVTRLDVLLDGLPVGDLHVRTCEPCQQGLIEHVRVDPPYRRLGLARRLVAAATAEHPGYAWSTTVIDATSEAQGFAQAGIWPGPPTPSWCQHMRVADDLVS